MDSIPLCCEVEPPPSPYTQVRATNALPFPCVRLPLHQPPPQLAYADVTSGHVGVQFSHATRSKANQPNKAHTPLTHADVASGHVGAEADVAVQLRLQSSTGSAEVVGVCLWIGNAGKTWQKQQAFTTRDGRVSGNLQVPSKQKRQQQQVEGFRGAPLTMKGWQQRWNPGQGCPAGRKGSLQLTHQQHNCSQAELNKVNPP